MSSKEEIESGVNMDEFMDDSPETDTQEEVQEQEEVVQDEQPEQVEETKPVVSVFDTVKPAKKPETVPFPVFERERDKYKERAQKAEAELEKLRQSQATPTEAEISGIFDETADEEDFVNIKQVKKLMKSVEQVAEKKVLEKLTASQQANLEAQTAQKVKQLEEQLRQSNPDYDIIIGKLSKLNLSEEAKQSILTADNPAQAAYQLGTELFGISQPQKQQVKQTTTNADEVIDDEAVFKEIFGG